MFRKAVRSVKTSSKSKAYLGLAITAFFTLGTIAFVYNFNRIQVNNSMASVNTFKQWDEITLDFTGSFSGSNSNYNNLTQNSNNPNPFMDTRLTVTFVNGNKTYVVPGYFVGNGSGGAGNKWRAHFTADKQGTWNYSAELRVGSKVAVNGGGGTVPIVTTSDTYPPTGSFNVSGNSNLGGFYSNCGMLKYVGKHYLQCAKTNQYWIKGGTNSPENFLKNADTDAGYTNIINSLNYLSSKKVNSIYFLPMNIGGDGNGDTHPFTAISEDGKTHYDTNKLSKWNNVFKEAMKKEISIEFVLNEAEDGNRNYLGLSLTDMRKLFYRELVSRYSHHLAVKWVLTEENRWPSGDLKAFAKYIRDTDPYDHPIGVHTNLDNTAFYHELLGNNNFESTSIQFTAPSGEMTETASAHAEEWRRRSKSAGRPWVVDLDEAIVEDSTDSSGMSPSNMDDLRRKSLYPALFSGGNISWYYGINQDLGLTLDKLQSRSAMWDWMYYARNLLYEFPYRHEMIPGDHLILNNRKAQLFYKPGKAYLVYLYNTGGGSENAKINLSEINGQNVTKRWFNPRSGTYAGGNSTITASAQVEVGAPPNVDRQDWVVVFSVPNGSSLADPPSDNYTYAEQGGIVVIQPENRVIAGGWAKLIQEGSTGNGYVKWVGHDLFTQPGSGVIEYNVKINTPGNYTLIMRSNKKHPEADNANDLFIKIDDGPWKKTANTHNQINKWVWSTFYIVPPGETAVPANANFSAGNHKIYLSGRSKGFMLDRIHLYLPGTFSGDPQNINLPESSQSSALQCNSVCTSDSQCTQTNPNWYCATQFTYGAWQDLSSTILTLPYQSGSSTVEDMSPTSGMNKFVVNGVTQNHAVRAGKVFYTEGVLTSWDQQLWQDVTSSLSNEGCSAFANGCAGTTIIDFSSAVKPSGRTDQYFIRQDALGNTKLFYRNNDDGGFSAWVDVEPIWHISQIGGANTQITGFTSYVDKDGNIVQDMVKGGSLWHKNTVAGWGAEVWKDLTSGLNECTGTGAGKCGNAPLKSVKRTIHKNGKEELYLIRAGGKVYYRDATVVDEKCRLKSNPYTANCTQ